MAVKHSTPKIDRSMVGLRDALLDEWDDLRAGGGDIKKAQAVASLARQILSAVKVEVYFSRHVAETGAAGPTIAIGTTRR